MQTFTINQKEECKAFFNEHGWVHIKNVFTTAQIDSLRENAYKMQDTKYEGDILGFSETTDLLLDDRLVDMASLLLDDEKPLYFGDSSGYNIGNTGAAGFHKDNPDKFDETLPDWQSEYSIIRFGIYCQSHVNYSASLALRDKSQNTVNCEKGDPFFVNNDAGDLLIWSLRTSHSGNSMRLRFAPNLFLHPRWYNKLPNFLFAGIEKERVAYFLSFGKADAHLKRYLTYMLNRQYMVKSWQQSTYSDEILEKVKQKNNITLVNMHDAVKDIDINTVKVSHTEMAADVKLFDFEKYILK